MFVLNCESRGLLNVDRKSDYFDSSLRKIILDIRKQYKKGKTESHTSTKTFDKILLLFGLLKNEDIKIGSSGFGKKLFSEDFKNFFDKHKISDRCLNEALFGLSFDGDGKVINYGWLSDDHLGSIFEDMLDYNLEISDKKTIYLENSKRTKKKTGSYYTPRHIVDQIVSQTLESVCGDTFESLLSLRICDPACGSGFFLLGALRFLEQKVQSLKSNSNTEFDINKIRQKLLKSCIFGVDTNPLAIDLTKLSLWLYSARKDYLLDSIDDHFMCGNALIKDKKLNGFTWKTSFPEVFSGKKGFDAIIGNPPYVFTRYKKFTIEEKRLYSKYKYANFQLNTYSLFVERSFELLNKNGALGFIIPKNWMSLSTMKSFRKMLATKPCDLKVINQTYRVFKDVAVDTSIVISHLSGRGEIKVYDSRRPVEMKLNYVDNLSKYSDGVRITLTKSDKSHDILNKINSNSVYLEKLALTTSGLEVYGLNKGIPPQTKQMMSQKVYHSKQKKDKFYLKFLWGKDVKRYHIKWSGDYLKYGKNLSGPRNPNLFKGNRILVRQIPSKPPNCIVAAMVKEDELSDRNCMIVKNLNSSRKDLYFILASLNSKIMSFWFDHTFQKLQRKTFPQFKLNELKRFPIPKLNFSNSKDLKLHGKLVVEAKKIEQKYKQNNIDNSTKCEIESCDLNVENYLAKLFNLTEGDLKYILNYYNDL